MRDLRFIKKLAIGTMFGALLTVGTALTASAQNVSREYREWQQAQIQAQREYQQYLRTRRASDYRDWQRAQQRVQRQYAQYQRAASRNVVVNNGYYNNGYYNDGYNNAGYTVPGRMYRINRGGSYYSVDSRGVELLRAAVQSGYNQGYRQGQIDRQYRRSYNFGTHSLYRTGTYGYQSYVARDQYQYYFQQGFQRGYEDGFNSTYRYGVRSNNGLNILGGVLNTILRIVD